MGRKSPGSEPPFLTASIDQSCQLDPGPPPCKQAPNPLRPINLMPTHRHQIHIIPVHIQVDLPKRLRRVSVEKHLILPAQLPDGLDILNHPELIVDGVNGDPQGIGSNRVLDIFDRNQSVRIDGQVGDLEALHLQVSEGVQHAFVLDLTGDEMPFFF